MAGRKNIRAREPRKNLIGVRYGKLVVQAWAGNSHWICLCDCGNTTRVLTANLNRDNTRSCGCIRNAASGLRNTKHGLHNTHVYNTWVGIRRRCLDPKCGRAYQDYGARGIGVDEEWAADILAFVRDVGHSPSANHTLDRIDNNKGYFPGNVRWATPMEQGSNKRNNRWVTFQGKKYTIAQLARKIAEECGISPKQFSRAFEKAICAGDP